MRQAVRQTLTILKSESFLNNEDTQNALLWALKFADDKALTAQKAIRELGEGFIAEEALAIAVYCALKAKSYTEGVLTAVNHDGNSSGTGSICGNILGALYGYKALPKDWLAMLELRDFLEHMTRILHQAASIRGIRFAGQRENPAEFAGMWADAP